MHNLLENFVDDPKTLLKKTRAKLKKVLALDLEDHRIRRSLTPEFEAIAQKSLHEFSPPITTNITMVQANQFCGKAHEDASAHLQHFLKICSTFTIKEYLEMLFYSAFSYFHY
jgi:hypothetical protein